MVRGTARVALLFALGLLQSVAAQDFGSFLEKQSALVLAQLQKMNYCTVVERIAGAVDQHKAAGISLAQITSEIEKQPQDFPKQLVALIATDTFERPRPTGTAIVAEVDLTCETQLAEQIKAKLAGDMPEEEKDLVYFVMTGVYAPKTAPPNAGANSDRQ